jgi:hypothetical protein
VGDTPLHHILFQIALELSLRPTPVQAAARPLEVGAKAAAFAKVRR